VSTFAAVWLLASCVGTAGPEGPFADLRGTWDFTGQQVAPARELVGTLTISNQTEHEITGSLAFEERDGLGGVVAMAGPVAGVVIKTTDADFDATLAAGARRHLAQLSANGDTLKGAWAQLANGRSGEFTAVRTVTP